MSIRIQSIIKSTLPGYLRKQVLNLSTFRYAEKTELDTINLFRSSSETTLLVPGGSYCPFLETAIRTWSASIRRYADAGFSETINAAMILTTNGGDISENPSAKYIYDLEKEAEPFDFSMLDTIHCKTHTTFFFHVPFPEGTVRDDILSNRKASKEEIVHDWDAVWTGVDVVAGGYTGYLVDETLRKVNPWEIESSTTRNRILEECRVNKDYFEYILKHTSQN